MKTSKILCWITLAVLLFSASCNINQPHPEELATKYVTAVLQQDYDEAITYLSVYSLGAIEMTRDEAKEYMVSSQLTAMAVNSITATKITLVSEGNMLVQLNVKAQALGANETTSDITIPVHLENGQYFVNWGNVVDESEFVDESLEVNGVKVTPVSLMRFPEYFLLKIKVVNNTSAPVYWAFPSETMGTLTFKKDDPIVSASDYDTISVTTPVTIEPGADPTTISIYFNGWRDQKPATLLLSNWTTYSQGALIAATEEVWEYNFALK
jgi:hypothetical protein